MEDATYRLESTFLRLLYWNQEFPKPYDEEHLLKELEERDRIDNLPEDVNFAESKRVRLVQLKTAMTQAEAARRWKEAMDHAKTNNYPEPLF